ncbi:hypothetical protein EGI16_16150 [Chryseobacterium sp. G0240]|uniref:hypothetical protein n=1 Tax=Chryseobacterium sp. G0240 TaxID=2487066 RepID=UPI000F44DCFE|nr:hypothetical protein [Chryseobacterium sp. G0240]ROI01832.1 hypothetical protein EGI16_16150 [Chryseobacterium sp. G0240]
MKKIMTGALALSLFVSIVSCKKEVKTETSATTDSLNTAAPVDSMATAPKTDSATASAPSATSGKTENIITKNVGKYPHEIKFFEDKNITERLKKLVGAQYDEMVKFFNVESPVTSENEIYKLNGCKQHDCPGYSTTIYYDSKNDNLNVSIDKNGKVTDFAEKGKITVSDVLKAK